MTMLMEVCAFLNTWGTTILAVAFYLAVNAITRRFNKYTR